MTHALIDADLVAFRCAASCEEEEAEGLSLFRCRNLVERILNEIDATAYTLYLTGSDNFRKKLDPQYKANRKDKPLPKWLEQCREYLVTEWKAQVTDGIEADDALGIAQTTDTIICSLDKDLLQVPGMHYSWEISGPGWTRPALKQHISEEEGLRRFWIQTIVGDVSDNITGIKGLGPKRTERAFAYIDETLYLPELNLEYYEIVKGLYNDIDRLHLNCKLLWILRTEGGIWEPPAQMNIREINSFPENFLGKDETTGT